MSVIPQSFNQGTGFVGSVSTGGTIPSEIDDLIVTNSLTSLGTTTLEGPTVINSTLDVSGDVTVNNATVNGFLTAPNLAITAVNKNDNTPFPVLFYDATTKQVCIGDPATLSSFTYNPNTRKLILENAQITNADIPFAQISILTALDAYITAATKSDNTEYTVVLQNPANNEIVRDAVQTNLTYNPGRGRLTTEKLAITTLPQDNTDNNNRYILFQGVDNEIHGDSNLLFNPSTGILTAPNLAIEAVNKNDNTPFPVLFYDATTKKVCIGDPATFTYNPFAQRLTVGLTTISALSVDSGLLQGQFVLGGTVTATQEVSTPTIGATVAVEFNLPTALPTTVGQVLGITNLTGANGHPNTSWQTATAGALIAAPKGNNFEYVVPFIDPVSGDVNKDSQQSHFTYNPGRNGRLTVEKLAITTLPQDNTDNNNRYILFKGVDNEIHGDSKLLFNPSTNLLAITDMNCQDITSTGSVSTAELSVGPPPSGTREIRVLGATGNGGTIFNDTSANPSAYFGLRSDTGSTFGIAYNIGMWNDGHMRYQATTNGHRFYVRNNNVTEQIVHITPTSILMTKNLFLEGEARLRLDKDIRFQETDSTTAGTKGIINWEQIGSIIAYRNNSTTASLSMVNKYAQDLGTNMQIQLQNNATLINTPDTGATGKISLQVASNERVAITDDLTTFSHAVDPNVLKTPDNNYMKLPTGTPSLGDAIRFSGTGAGTISNPWLTEWG